MTAIGIDLGTTNSVISRLEGGKAVPIPIDGHAIVPSVAFFDGSRVIVGREARNLELLHPDRTIRSVKRRMGTSEAYAVGDRMIAPEEVSAEILRALREGAERALGEPVRDVVITVPAYFDDAQRRATLRAGELAGLSVQRLLNEPTSASLCYEQVGTVKQPPTAENVMVFDLGGGTFDVSVLEVWDSVREVRATAGNTRLGGDDFDDKLLGLFVDELKRRSSVDPREDARALARLRRLAEETKIRLSFETSVAVREEFVMTGPGGKPVHLELEVTRRRFEGLIEDLLTEAVGLAVKALADAKLAGAPLSRILLVGGSTRIPLVRALLEEQFRAPVHEEIDADLAVGLGAAIQSAILQDVPIDRVLVDVAAHSLGIRVLGEDDVDHADTFAAILRRNTVLPASREEEFYTVHRDQECLDVDVFQGEETRASRNALVGSFRCDLAPAPARSPVTVSFSYDLNGVVTVSVRQPGRAPVKTVALSVADATVRPTPSGSDSPSPSAEVSSIERRAVDLASRVSGEAKKRVDVLLAALRAAAGSPEARAHAEDALLDFFVDVEAGEAGDDLDDDDLDEGDDRGEP